jgi:hypothetical protein
MSSGTLPRPIVRWILNQVQDDDEKAAYLTAWN